MTHLYKYFIGCLHKIHFRYTLLSSIIFIFITASAGYGQVKYIWQPTSGSNSWTNAANWSSSPGSLPRTTPASTDILEFSKGGTVILTNVPTQTIQQLLVLNNTNVDLQAASNNLTLTLSGAIGTDLNISSGAALTISSNNILNIRLSALATGLISGNMTFSGSATHTLDATDASAIVINNGAVFTQNSTGNAFTTTNTDNTIIFASGSTFISNNGGSPFGKPIPNSKVSFQTGSTYIHKQTAAPSFSGRTYGNFEMDAAAYNQTSTGSGAMTVYDFTIKSATTVNMNLTGGINIKGNVTVTTGSLNFAPTAANTTNFNGTGTQIISGAGNITTNTNTSLVVASTSNTILNKSFTSTGNLQIEGILQFDATTALTLTVTGSLSGIGTIDMSSGDLTHILNLGGATNNGVTIIQGVGCNSSINYNRAGNQTVAAGNYANLSIAGTGTKILQGDISVCKALTVATGATLALGTYNADVTLSTTVTGTLDAATGAIKGAGSFTLNNTATLITASPNGISTGTTLGSIQVAGSRTYLTGTLPGASFIYNGPTNQITGDNLPLSITNFTINTPATLTMSRDVAIVGASVFTSGILSINGNTLTLNGTTSVAGTGSISGGNTSRMIVSGSSGVATNLPDINNGLFSLYINKTGAGNDVNLKAGETLTLYNGGSLTLQVGVLRNANTLILGENASSLVNIIRYANASSLNGTPTFSNKVNLTYMTGGATGAELPTAAPVLNHLTVTNGGVLVTLLANATVNGTLTINTFNNGLSLNGRTLTINGDYVNSSSGTFYGSATSSIIINGNNQSASQGLIKFNQVSVANRTLANFTLNRTGSGSAFIISTSVEITNAFINSGTLTATGSDILMTNSTVGAGGKFINNSGAFPATLPSSPTARAFNNTTFASVNKFDILTGSADLGNSITANATDLTFARNGAGSVYAFRRKSINLAPTTAIVRFTLQGTTSNSATNTAGKLILGSNLIDDASLTNAAASLEIDLKNGNTLALSSTDASYQSGDYANPDKEFWWVINKSGSSQTYTGPDGKNYTITDKTAQLWYNGSRLTSSLSLPNGLQSLEQVKFVMDNGNGTIKINNLRINPIMQITIPAECWYAGRSLNVAVTVSAAGPGSPSNVGTTFNIQRSDINGNFSDFTSNIYGTFVSAAPITTSTFTMSATFPDKYGAAAAAIKDLGDKYRYRVISSDLLVVSEQNNYPMYYIINPGPETLEPNFPTLAAVTAYGSGTYTTSYWAYRNPAGGNTVTKIPGTDNITTYIPKLTDFPGTGEYFLMAVSTSDCATNEKKVLVNCSGSANLIKNGDFDDRGSKTGNFNDLDGDGNIEFDQGDFFTQYSPFNYDNVSQIPQGYFTIAPNPKQYNGAFCNMTTLANRAPTKDSTGTIIDGGNMLITDAATSGSRILWQQKVTGLTPNTNYVFTFWGTSIDQAHQNTLQFAVYVDCYRLGDDIADNYSSACQWTKYSVQVNTGNQNELTLSIGNVSATGGGNDVGIDNIELYKCDSDPGNNFSQLNKFVWKGYTSDWFKSDNWGVCEPNLPTCADDVIIPNNLPAGRFYPVINGNYPNRTPDSYDSYGKANINATTPMSLIGTAAQVQNIAIETGAMLTINDTRNLRVCGNIINNGTITTNLTGTITLFGNALQNISGTGIFSNMAIDQANSTTTALVNQLSNVTVNGLLDIKKGADELSINGKILSFNGTLSSSATSGTITGITADPATNTSSMIIGGTGNVTGLLKFTTGSQSLHKLTMNRTINGQVTLGTPLNLIGGANALTLTDGLIYTTTTNLLSLSENSTVTGSSIINPYPSGGSNSSFINGPMAKVVNTSTGTFTFPVGKNIQLSQIGIIPNMSAATKKVTFRAEYFPENPYTAFSYNFENTLHHISKNEYWMLDRLDGTDGIDGGKVRLHWAPYSDASTLAITNSQSMRVARFDAPTPVWQDKGGIVGDAYYNSGYVTSDGANGEITKFSPFTLASTVFEIPLPVELIDLKAVAVKKVIQVSWQTANEHNSAHFIVERSADGVNFTALAKKVAAGESKTVCNYAYTDTNPLSGTNYYRLQQVDTDGTAAASKIVWAEMATEAETRFEIYPNPSNGGALSIQVPYRGEIQVSIYDLTGSQVELHKVKADGQMASVSPRKTLSQGMYLVRVVTPTHSYQQKLIVK